MPIRARPIRMAMDSAMSVMRMWMEMESTMRSTTARSIRIRVRRIWTAMASVTSATPMTMAMGSAMWWTTVQSTRIWPK